LLVYDVTHRDTFNTLGGWLAELQGHSDPAVILVGNKADLPTPRQVEKEEGKDFAEQHGLLFAEVSARGIADVEAVFMTLAQAALQRQVADAHNLPSNDPIHPSSSSSSSTPKGCC